MFNKLFSIGYLEESNLWDFEDCLVQDEGAIGFSVHSATFYIGDGTLSPCSPIAEEAQKVSVVSFQRMLIPSIGILLLS